jgi:4-amino-4-deoxy-L-arabinose transferase-like glycosyltransferase
LGAFFGLRLVLRVAGASALNGDEATQFILSQWWALGYSSEPPLYAWLQRLTCGVFGVNLFAVALLRNVVMALACGALFFVAERLIRNLPVRVLATLSLLLIPHWAWEWERELSHASLAVTLGVTTLLVVLESLRRARLWLFVGLGAGVGLGILAQYYFVVFVLALAVTLASMPTGRTLLMDRRMRWTAVTLTAVIAPHLVWLAWHDWPLCDAGEPGGLWGRLAQWGWGVVEVTGVTVVVAVVLFRNRLRWQRPKDMIGPVPFPLGRLLGVGVTGTFLVAVVLVGREFPVHALLPVLFLFPLWAMTHVDPVFLQPQQWERVVKVLAVVMVVGVLTQFTLRAEFPTHEVAERARALGYERGLVVSDRAQLAGSLRLEFPDSVVTAAELGPALPPLVATNQTTLIVWDLGRSKKVPASLRAWLRLRLALDAGQLSSVPLRLAFGRGREQFSDVRLIVLTPAEAEKLRR